MNRFLLTLSIVSTFMCFGLISYIFTGSEKIVYIDTGRLMEQSREMRQLRDRLKQEGNKTKSNVDTLTAEFESLLRKYEQESAGMPAKEKEVRKEMLNKKRNSLLQYQQAVQSQMMQTEQKESATVLKRINAVIKEYGEAKGYKVILATLNGNIAYADQGIDITEEIIKEVNK